MISNSLAYAFKAIIYIAVNGTESRKIRIKDLSEAIDIPSAYVAKLLKDMVKHGILKSSKGPHGGFYFTTEGLDTNLMQVVNVLESSESYSRCLLTLENCDSTHPCPLHATIGQIRVTLVDNFKSITIGQLVKDVQEGRSFIS